MLIYILIFLLPAIIYFTGKPTCNISRQAFAAYMGFLALFVGLGDMLGGYDRYIYGALFDNCADIVRFDWPLSSSLLFTYYGKELGYIFFNIVIAQITSNRYIFILIATGLIYWLFYKSMVKEATNVGYVLLLFLGLFFFFSFTYIRQVIAVGIAWYSYRYIYTRNLKLFAICVILATSFHNSALLILPMYFVGGYRLSKKVILVCVSVCFLLGVSGIPSAIFEIYGEAADNSIRANGYVNDSSGFRPEYILEALVFLGYLLINRRASTFSLKENTHFNLAIMFCCILLLFCKSINGGRLCWPFMLGLICSLTEVVNFSSRTSAKAVSLVGLMFILYIRVLLGWGILLYPYKTFLTPGYREGDFIYMENEYDQRYTNDKFYR